ncbi:hypothetical protein KY334_04960 [Candidatus Woesearchaeota archaeon]|nr:hypothetical protein [Candidatus Woesearchaeota archaeon]
MLDEITSYGHNIENGELKKMVFLFDNAYYEVVFNKDGMELYNMTHTIHNKPKLVAKLNSETNNSIWMLDHCCGLQGFGALDDVCYGCKHNNGLESEENNISDLVMGGNYSQSLEKVLLFMPEYKSKFEETLKNF